MFKFSKRSAAVLRTVDPILQKIFNEAIEVTPIDFGIPRTGGLRTAGQQNDLYLAKKSKCDGYVRPSYHQTGKAVDVYAYVDGKASWKIEHLEAIAEVIFSIAKKHDVFIQWGGHWKSFKDYPHFQIRDY